LVGLVGLGAVVLADKLNIQLNPYIPAGVAGFIAGGPMGAAVGAGSVFALTNIGGSATGAW